MPSDHPESYHLPSWPTHTICRRFGPFEIKLQVIKDFDAVLDHCAELYPNDTDMIPYYADLWSSAEALSRFLVNKYETLHRKRVIELGCGLGLPSIICAKLGADVVATDFHPYNRKGFEKNAAANGVENISYRQMDWAAPESFNTFDIIIGSDLLYEPKQIRTLTDCIPILLDDNGIFILADPGRDHIQSATDALIPKGFNHQVTIENNTFIVTFTKKHNDSG
jgi:predicted nicotinamide N-methyase